MLRKKVCEAKAKKKKFCFSMNVEVKSSLRHLHCHGNSVFVFFFGVEIIQLDWFYLWNCCVIFQLMELLSYVDYYLIWWVMKITWYTNFHFQQTHAKIQIKRKFAFSCFFLFYFHFYYCLLTTSIWIIEHNLYFIQFV